MILYRTAEERSKRGGLCSWMVDMSGGCQYYPSDNDHESASFFED